MFPHGGPGVALLLLRFSVGAMLFHAALCPGWRPGPLLYTVVGVAASLSLSLIIGFLTPLLSSLACLMATACLLCDPRVEGAWLAPAILAAPALALLGPGAYSLDARLYGRRVTVVHSRVR